MHLTRHMDERERGGEEERERGGALFDNVKKKKFLLWMISLHTNGRHPGKKRLYCEHCPKVAWTPSHFPPPFWKSVRSSPLFTQNSKSYPISRKQTASKLLEHGPPPPLPPYDVKKKLPQNFWIPVEPPTVHQKLQNLPNI